jgi:hypothetical protein
MRRLLRTLFFLVALSACSQRSEPKLEPLARNYRPFQFEPTEVQQLSIVKSDPSTGDQWAAELRRSVEANAEKGRWQIVSAPIPILDRVANTSFIDHLLDTFRTLGVEEPAPKGPSGSFGLEPPRWAFRWQGFELRVGNPLGAGGAYALLPSRPEAYVVKGAALQMLGHLSEFGALRLQTLATFTADDVEEIEIRQSKRRFYVQRDGDTWTDAAHRPHKKNIPQLIETLTHWRIEKFIDNEKQAQEAETWLAGGPAIEVTVRDLHGKATILSFSEKQGKVLGKISSRKNSVFQLYPQIAKMVLSFF